MSRTHVIVERVRDRFDRAAQRGLDERRAAASRLAEMNRRASIAEEVRDDLERATANRSVAEAEIYRAEMRRALAEAAPVRAPAPSARETAEAVFAKAAADNGGLPPAPPVEERPVAKHDDQLDMFGGLRA